MYGVSPEVSLVLGFFLFLIFFFELVQQKVPHKEVMKKFPLAPRLQVILLDQMI